MTLLLCATLQDIDAAYIFDDDDELDANLSALLEVPDLEFLQTENPVVLNSHHIPGQKPARVCPLPSFASGNTAKAVA